MGRKGANQTGGSEIDVGRRTFVKQGGAALATGVGLAGAAASAEPARAGERWQPESADARARPWRRPNLVFLITDQERYPQHWPDGWVEANLPNRQRLAAQGLTFVNSFCSAAMCSPSRARRRRPRSTPRIQTIGKMLRDAGCVRPRAATAAR